MKKLYRSMLFILAAVVGSIVLLHLHKGQNFANVDGGLTDVTMGGAVVIGTQDEVFSRHKRIDEAVEIPSNLSSKMTIDVNPSLVKSPSLVVTNDVMMSKEKVAALENDILVKENVDCHSLLSDIDSGKYTSVGLCHYMDKALRLCLNTSDVGREPLKNFFVYQNSSAPSAYSQYREANIAFVHMPKAGGTSVEDILGRIYVNRKKILKAAVWHCSNLYKEAKSAKKHTDQYLYYSKRGYGLHDFVNPKRPFAYVTWFREPIGRLVSTYHYLKKKRCWSIHTICKKYLLPSRSLTDYIHNTPQIRLTDLDNFYVRLLQFGDYPDIDDTFEDCCGSVTLNDVHKIPIVEEKHYLVAKRNLEKMAFVGLTEDFKTSQDMVSHLFGIPIAQKEVHANANPHSSTLTDWELRELSKRNVWDLKLYEDAKRIYQEQKENYLRMLENE